MHGRVYKWRYHSFQPPAWFLSSDQLHLRHQGHVEWSSVRVLVWRGGTCLLCVQRDCFRDGDRGRTPWSKSLSCHIESKSWFKFTPENWTWNSFTVLAYRALRTEFRHEFKNYNIVSYSPRRLPLSGGGRSGLYIFKTWFRNNTWPKRPTQWTNFLVGFQLSRRQTLWRLRVGHVHFSPKRVQNRSIILNWTICSIYIPKAIKLSTWAQKTFNCTKIFQYFCIEIFRINVYTNTNHGRFLI